MTPRPKNIVPAVRNGRLEEVDEDELDYQITSPNQFPSANVNLIPMQSAVQGPRLFYGARFFNQAMPLRKPEPALVQALSDEDEQGRSFDEIMGDQMGNVRSDVDGEVLDVTPDYIRVRGADGKSRDIELYNQFPYNRKSGISNTPVVQKGSTVTAGQLLARSNYTDDTGTMAMGVNARVALVPFKGFSMDDAMVVSRKFADKLTSEHTETDVLELDNNIRLGLEHYRSLFPEQFTKDRLKHLDKDGVVVPGTVLRKDDPYILATTPRSFSSAQTDNLGKLSRALRQTRKDASRLWEYDVPGVVTDVSKTKKGVKVVIQSFRPADIGDKIVLRSGQKGTIAKIIEDDRMPRGEDGQPFEMLLNPLGLPSRVNSSLLYEILAGKVAAADGKAVKLPHFLPKGQQWPDVLEKMLKDRGLASEETVYDPESDHYSENPVTTGMGYVLKLHHIASSKSSARGQGGYDVTWQQPSKGGDAGAKRLSGLETHALLASGAYSVLREGATLRGTRSDDYWRALRSGRATPVPGKPFAWHKFRVLLQGAGMDTRELDKGVYRLSPMTDGRLKELRPVEVTNGELVDPDNFEPIAGGLFDPLISGGNRWGKITLPDPLPNPAYEESVRRLLGLTRKDFREVLAGRMELPDPV